MKFQFVEVIGKIITQISSGTPSGTSPGQFWYDSVADKFRGQKASSVVDLEGGAGGSISQTALTLDFGSIWVDAKTFTVTDALVSPTSKIQMECAGIGGGRSDDELEFEQVQVTCIPGTGNFKVVAKASGLITGAYKFIYLLSS